MKKHSGFAQILQVEPHEFQHTVSRLCNLASSDLTINGASSLESLMRKKKDLMRKKRDFMRLLRSYPMRITCDCACDSSQEVCDEKVFRYFEGIIPADILRGLYKSDERSFSISTYNYTVPKAILSLAVDLAVQQLIQTLIPIHNEYQCRHPHHMKYIRLSTRSEVEKRAVFAKIEAALNNKQHMLDILNSFHATLSFDASNYPASTENQFKHYICQLLHLPVIEDSDEILDTRLIEEEMSTNKYLVLLVDKNGEETIDLWKLGFRKARFAGVLVLITTDSTTQAKDREPMAELMDLEIQTRDHLLSWNVLCHNVGKKFVYASRAIMNIATRILEECRGHLLAIVLIAKWLLKNPQSAKHWELALDKMLHTDPSYVIEGHLSKIMNNTFLNLIWDSMNKAQKHCLLRCLFIPEIKNGKLDRVLMDDWVSSLYLDAEEAEQNLWQLLHISVLLQFEGIGGRRYIRLPEEIYQILKSISISNPLTELPDTDQWQSAIQIELGNNKLSELPLSPNCPELKVLMLQGNADLTKIPSSFFVHMPLLCILNLSYTSVRELPHSLFLLEQLRELYLKGCECLMKLPPEIGNLQKLEMLDLDETQITHLPEEVQKLTCVESLTLYLYEYRSKKNKPYSYSRIIPSGVLSKLKRLKHLRIGVNPNDERWHDNVQLILPEIFELKWLQTLSIYIPQLELLKVIPTHILKVADFRFIIGHHMQRIMSSIPPEVDLKFKQSDCSLKFVKGNGVPAEVKKLVRHSKALFLDRHSTIKNLSEFERENLQQLRVCILAECKEMQTIVGGEDDDMLSHLLLLSVSHMKNLRSIWEGPTFPPLVFGMLQSLSLQSCPKLITLFSMEFLGNLSLLKELFVKECPKLRTLINRESSLKGSNAGTFLPKLWKLSLVHLPELSSISKGLHIGPGLKEIAFYDCPKLLQISKEELSSNELISIKGETKWWNAVKGRTPKYDMIFIPIDEEADVITQIGIYKDDNAHNGPEIPEKSLWTLPKHAPDLNCKDCMDTKHRSSHTREIYTSSPEDRYTWRKYGQKEILGYKYPRSYYRCSQMGRRCHARKAVQRVEEDPILFRITYEGHHTCKDKGIVPQNI